MGSGGGGSAGKVDYPSYMKSWHEDGLGTINEDISTLMEARLGNSPLTGINPYDPDGAIANMASGITAFNTVASAIEGYQDWSDYVDIAVAKYDAVLFSEVELNEKIASYNDIVDADINTVTLPKFRRGMQNINAVNTSAFVIGEALIEAEAGRNKAKFAADMKVHNYKDRIQSIMTGIETMGKFTSVKADIERALTQAILEKERMTIIAKKEEVEQDIHISDMDGRWDFEVWQYGGNFLSSIGNASVRTPGGSALASGLGAGITAIGAVISAFGSSSS